MSQPQPGIVVKTGFASSTTAVNGNSSVFWPWISYCADGDLLHVGQDVELRQRDLGRTLNLYAIARGDQIDRADAARTAGRGAVFGTGLTKGFRLFTEPLRRERAFANTGGYAFTIPTVRSTWLPGIPAPTQA